MSTTTIEITIALPHLLTSEEGVENLHDLLTLRRREFFHLAEPPPEAGRFEKEVL